MKNGSFLGGGQVVLNLLTFWARFAEWRGASMGAAGSSGAVTVCGSRSPDPVDRVHLDRSVGVEEWSMYVYVHR